MSNPDNQIAKMLLRSLLQENLESVHRLVSIGNFEMARWHLETAREQISQIENLHAPDQPAQPAIDV